MANADTDLLAAIRAQVCGSPQLGQWPHTLIDTLWDALTDLQEYAGAPLNGTTKGGPTGRPQTVAEDVHAQLTGTTAAGQVTRWGPTTDKARDGWDGRYRTLAELVDQIRAHASTLDEDDEEESPVVLSGAPVGDGRIRLDWVTSRTDVTGWTVARAGVDTHGTGPWTTTLPAAARTFTMGSLVGGLAYHFTVVGHTATEDLIPAVAIGIATGDDDPADPEPEPVPGLDGVTAAATLGWGLPDWSDEMDYTGPPDPAKWNNAPTAGMAGHDHNGRRVGYCTTVHDGMMTLRGLPNGDTGWCRQAMRTHYGRWEIRLKSRNIGSAGNLYHVLALIWPTSEDWPADGEYDWVEVVDPDANKLSAFLHYPHPDTVPTQQEYVETAADMNTWQNVAFDWSASGMTGYLNGRQWFRFAGGASSKRRAIQDMPEGYLTLQLDNFHGAGMREAVMDVQWVRFWKP